MGRHAEWEVVNMKPGIVLIRDLGRSGCLSITNDAEYVYDTINRFTGRDQYRVVYEDTQGEWAEIIKSASGPFKWRMSFKPWHGEVWDNLTKTY